MTLANEGKEGRKEREKNAGTNQCKKTLLELNVMLGRLLEC